MLIKFAEHRLNPRIWSYQWNNAHAVTACPIRYYTRHRPKAITNLTVCGGLYSLSHTHTCTHTVHFKLQSLNISKIIITFQWQIQRIERKEHFVSQKWACEEQHSDSEGLNGPPAEGLFRGTLRYSTSQTQQKDLEAQIQTPEHEQISCVCFLHTRSPPLNLK